MWKLACCGGSYLQILGRSGYDKWEWAVWMHSIPVICNHPQKEQPDPSQCLTCHWGGRTLLPMPWRAVCGEKFCLLRFVKKQFHLGRTNHQSTADPPSPLGLRCGGISARLKFLCAACVTSCLVLWFSAVLLLLWGDCGSSELMDCWCQ